MGGCYALKLPESIGSFAMSIVVEMVGERVVKGENSAPQ